MIRSLVIAAALVAASPSLAEPIVGVASVIDGDTIEIHRTRIRINGIDAPESRQLCLDAAGKQYRCGQQSALALDDFLAAHDPASCIEVDRDRYGRAVAVCTAGGVDVADWMVRQGHALDWPRYSQGEYAPAEKAARSARRGMWAGSFARPWEWRRGRDTAPLIGAGL